MIETSNLIASVQEQIMATTRLFMATTRNNYKEHRNETWINPDNYKEDEKILQLQQQGWQNPWKYYRDSEEVTYAMIKRRKIIGLLL